MQDFLNITIPENIVLSTKSLLIAFSQIKQEQIISYENVLTVSRQILATNKEAYEVIAKCKKLIKEQFLMFHRYLIKTYGEGLLDSILAAPFQTFAGISILPIISFQIH